MTYHFKTGYTFESFFSRYLLIIGHVDLPPQYQAELANILLYYYSRSALFLNDKKRKARMPYKTIEFVSVRLNEQQKRDFVVYEKDEGIDLGEQLTNLILDGYKLSISYAEKTGSFVASVTCRSDDSPNTALCVSSHHETPYKAVLVALFKHFTILDQIPWKEYAKGDDWG